MRQNPNYFLQEVAGSLVLVPVGEATMDFPGMVTVNGTSKFLWERLAEPQTEESLVSALLAQYDVSPELAREDVRRFVETLTAVGAIID